jgi:cation:H+ antiporter
MLLTHVPLYIISFVAIWFGAGLIIKAVDRIAHQLSLSSFAISFFVLGVLTSIPETAVSFNAIIDHKPEIFVGTLLGGTVVIFLLIIPILAILGKGIKLTHELSRRNLGLALLVMVAPALVVIDQKVTNFEGLLLIGFYLALFYIIQRKHGIFDKEKSDIFSLRAYSFIDLAKVALGIGIVFIASDYIVEQTIVFSQFFSVPSFYLSLIILSLGTNLPELSLAVRAVISGKKDIAFGDYLGSASANTLLFGFFTVLNDGEVITENHFYLTFLFIALGLGLFYYFSKSDRNISVKEGLILLFVYILFVVYELGKEIIF